MAKQIQIGTSIENRTRLLHFVRKDDTFKCSAKKGQSPEIMSKKNELKSDAFEAIHYSLSHAQRVQLALSFSWHITMHCYLIIYNAYKCFLESVEYWVGVVPPKNSLNNQVDNFQALRSDVPWIF